MMQLPGHHYFAITDYAGRLQMLSLQLNNTDLPDEHIMTHDDSMTGSSLVHVDQVLLYQNNDAG